MHDGVYKLMDFVQHTTVTFEPLSELVKPPLCFLLLLDKIVAVFVVWLGLIHLRCIFRAILVQYEDQLWY